VPSVHLSEGISGKNSRQINDLLILPLHLRGTFVRLREGLFWWIRGESNPRPQAIAGRFYMRSCLIWI